MHLNNVTVPRLILGGNEITEIQIHGFAEASTAAYGACLYVRFTDESELICAKSQVAPTKVFSLPRLEPCAPY